MTATIDLTYIAWLWITFVLLAIGVHIINRLGKNKKDKDE